jgi:hypothetical protein
LFALGASDFEYSKWLRVRAAVSDNGDVFSACKVVLGAAAAALLTGCSGDSTPPPARKAAPPPEPVKITQFYASPVVAAAGQPVLLCYGVEHAKTVALAPPVADIDPSPNRCVQFTPQRTGSYTLTAAGAAGGQATASVTVRVTAKAAGGAPTASGNRLIGTFAASSERVAAGQPVTLCYALQGAASVRIEPPAGDLAPGERGCTTVRPARTTTYTLSASAGGRTETARVTVRVAGQ